MIPRRGSLIKREKSHITYGGIYHALYDRYQVEARGVVVGIVPAGSTVLDMACGTGELCFELARSKNCDVVGVDVSSRMIEFAQGRNRWEQVRFLHGDGADLTSFQADAFDYATIMFLLHEVCRDKQVAVLNEALRVAPRAIVIDAQVPLPRNLHGLGWRLVEFSFGLAHYRVFADYLAAGGIDGILADPRLQTSISRRWGFWHGCREVVMLERKSG